MLQHPDSLRAVLDTVFAAPAYQWVRGRQSRGVLHRVWQAIREWWSQFARNNPDALKTLLVVLLIIFVAVVLHAAWRFVQEVRATDRLASPLDRMITPRDEAWYRREADRLAHSGRYAEAIQADFVALVLALDARSALRYHPSKTPAEYVREPALNAGSREEFRDLVGRLYGYAFARVPCGPDEFADWRMRAAVERYAPAH